MQKNQERKKAPSRDEDNVMISTMLRRSRFLVPSTAHLLPSLPPSLPPRFPSASSAGGESSPIRQKDGKSQEETITHLVHSVHRISHRSLQLAHEQVLKKVGVRDRNQEGRRDGENGAQCCPSSGTCRGGKRSGLDSTSRSRIFFPRFH